MALAILGCALCIVYVSVLDHERLLQPLTVFLVAFALITNLVAARWDDSLEISGSLIAALAAAALIGPVAAFVVAALAEAIAWAIERLRPIALPLNILGIGAPALLAGLTLLELFPFDEREASATFYGVFGLTAFVAAALNLAIVRGVHVVRDGSEISGHMRLVRQMLPVWSINIAVTVTVVAVYATAGLSVVALLLAGLLAFAYQLRLVARAEDRTRSYAALSWGVLSGMVRNLDMRDSRTARHSAAVAQFARDIATEAGLPERDCELAHTAGLLHDVGKFALSDRVMERGTGLTDDDWKGVRRHPELGAAMLKDVGGYGPVAEIVRAHHERLDGRGYPAGLTAEEIPEVAKIVAVAEIYDTLTADDSYRTKMSSFEALRELRRVAGSQLEPSYVEALARTLAGRDLEYRHAGAADFDRELDLERRIGAAVDARDAAV